MVAHADSMRTAIHGVAYNYHWKLDYIESSFSLEEIARLLDDAVLFNPWVSKKKSDPEEIPEDEYLERRRVFEEQRKKWEARDTSNV